MGARAVRVALQYEKEAIGELKKALAVAGQNIPINGHHRKEPIVPNRSGRPDGSARVVLEGVPRGPLVAPAHLPLAYTCV